jgi:hypothetical protein
MFSYRCFVFLLRLFSASSPPNVQPRRADDVIRESGTATAIRRWLHRFCSPMLSLFPALFVREQQGIEEDSKSQYDRHSKTGQEEDERRNWFVSVTVEHQATLATDPPVFERHLPKDFVVLLTAGFFAPRALQIIFCIHLSHILSFVVSHGQRPEVSDGDEPPLASDKHNKRERLIPIRTDRFCSAVCSQTLSSSSFKLAHCVHSTCNLKKPTASPVGWGLISISCPVPGYVPTTSQFPSVRLFLWSSL